MHASSLQRVLRDLSKGTSLIGLTHRHVEGHASLDEFVVAGVERLYAVAQLQADGGAHVLGQLLNQGLLSLGLHMGHRTGKWSDGEAKMSEFCLFLARRTSKPPAVAAT